MYFFMKKINIFFTWKNTKNYFQTRRELVFNFLTVIKKEKKNS